MCNQDVAKFWIPKLSQSRDAKLVNVSADEQVGFPRYLENSPHEFSSTATAGIPIDQTVVGVVPKMFRFDRRIDQCDQTDFARRFSQFAKSFEIEPQDAR